MLKNKKSIMEVKDYIVNDYDTQEEMINELRRYKKEFNNVLDYEYYQKGNMLIGDYEIEEHFKNCEYKIENYSIDKIRNLYKYHVRLAIDELLKGVN